MWAVDPHILLYRSSRSISVFFFNIGCFSHKLWQHGGVLKAQKCGGTKSEIELFNGRRAESSQRRELREMTAD